MSANILGVFCNYLTSLSPKYCVVSIIIPFSQVGKLRLRNFKEFAQNLISSKLKRQDWKPNVYNFKIYILSKVFSSLGIISNIK